MKVAIVRSSALSGRMDARFHILREEHLALAEELQAKFTLPQLVELLKTLPYDHGAAEAVCPAMSTGTFSGARGQAYFTEWATNEKRKSGELAAYCAAASQFAAGKVLEELVTIAKQKKAKLDALCALIQTANDAGADLLKAAIRRSSGVI